MEKTVFFDFYEDVVKPLANKICNNNLDAKMINNPNTLYEEYLKQRSLYRILCDKPVHANSEDENSLLDRHKVAALICSSICNTRIIYKSSTEETVKINDYQKLNEQLAIEVALSVLKGYIITNNPILKESFRNGFYFPTTTHSEDSKETYEDVIVRSLFLANISNQISLPLLAHIFFLIEKYHSLYWEPAEKN